MPRPVVPSALPPLRFSSSSSSSAVVGQDDMGVAADLEVLAGDAAPLQVLDLADKRGRVQHDAVGDDAERLGVQDARRESDAACTPGRPRRPCGPALEPPPQRTTTSLSCAR